VIPDLVVTRWGARFGGRRFPCATGRGGVGVKRAEGDRVTPVGRHRIEAVLFRPDHGPAPRLGRGLAALPIGPRDGWSDDPLDPAYNRRVRRPHPFRHEPLRRRDRLYDLVAVLDWNRHPAVPGEGSAIFLHLWRGPRRPTAGCIAFRRPDLAFILARWNPGSRVVVSAWPERGAAEPVLREC
jgi:L,D-peptidoglycan transpeptidase YkuD (ErfK/YbiS/YcfS/YnhG family)